MSLDAGDSRCNGRSFSLEKRTDDPESVRQWLLQSWVSVCFSQRLFLKARVHHRNLAYKLLAACHVRNSH